MTTKKNSGTNQMSYDYDALNRMSSSTPAGGTATTYTYDAIGQRIGKQTGTATTKSLWEKGRIVEDFFSTGSNTSENIYVQGLSEEGTIKPYLDGNGNTSFTNFHLNSYNINGDVAATWVINTNTAASAYNFDAYGNKTSGGALPSPYSYNGYYTDSETGFFYLNARYYDPTTQQFTQEDTYWGDGTNLYAYCGGNPVMYSDPSGHYKTVKSGSRGDDVKTLQRILNANGAQLAVDGSFGPKTLAAVKNYQASHGLAVDGSVGPLTWGSLTKSLAPPTRSVSGGINRSTATSISYISKKDSNQSKIILLDPQAAGYLFSAAPIRRNDKDGVTAAAFYGKGSGPCVTINGQTWGFETDRRKTKKQDSIFDIQIFDFETGLCEMNFDNGINIDTVKFSAGLNTGFSGIKVNTKIALVEFGLNAIEIPILFTEKKIKIGIQYDLGSLGAGIEINHEVGLKWGWHLGAGYDYSIKIQ